MGSFFKKRTSQSLLNGPAKKTRTDSSTSERNHPNLFASPRIIVAWNCDGLSSRLRSQSEMRLICDFLVNHKPDVMFLSEVRLPAASSKVSGSPAVNTKRIRSQIRDNDKKSAEDASLVRLLMSSEELSPYKLFLSLSDTKYSGTAMLLNTKTTNAPLSVRYNLELPQVRGSLHHSDGRVIYAKFKHFSILHTYSPNNGWEERRFTRRREWDLQIQSFVKRKKDAGINLIWVGDLNIAPQDADLSHSAYFRRQKFSSQSSKSNDSERTGPECIGQPGCTDAERHRFGNIVEEGDLVDAYRFLKRKDESTQFTWRGNPIGRYSGRGMRIDLCLVSRDYLPNVECVQITGSGSNRKGFMGSDHCPIVVSLKKPTERDPSDEKEALGSQETEQKQKNVEPQKS